MFILPLIAILSISFSNSSDIVEYGYKLLPVHFTDDGYAYLFNNPKTILDAYKVTIIITVAGTLVFLVMGSLCAYPLSRIDFRYRSPITFYLFFTMLFSGGLVPWYILMTQYLHLKNTYLAMVLPCLGNVWYIFLMRTFFQQIPTAIIESAVIDGASEFRIYLKMILPLSKPVLATISLFQVLSCWNTWYTAMLFITKEELFPLQYLLQNMLLHVQETLSNAMSGTGVVDYEELKNLPAESIRMAMCILSIGPILFVFPFFQKYFTKGLTVGSVKG